MNSQRYTRFWDESDNDSQPSSPSPATQWWPMVGRVKESIGCVIRIRESSSATLLSPQASRLHEGWWRGKWNLFKWRWLMPLLQLSGEAFVGFFFWTALVEFIRNVYWFQLQSGGVAPEIGFLAYLVTPAVVLGQPMLREFLDSHPWTRSLLLLCGLVGVWGHSESTPLRRVSFSGNSVAILSVYVFEGLWAGTTARRRRTGFGMIGGILLLQALRWAYAGPNPIVATTWGFVLIGVVPGVCTAFLVLTEDVAEWEGDDIAVLQGHPEKSASERERIDRELVDALSDDWGEDASRDMVVEFERRCHREFTGEDDLEMQPLKEEPQHMSLKHGEVYDDARRLSVSSNQEEIELVEMEAELPTSTLVTGQVNEVVARKTEHEGQLGGICLQSWEDETVGKRWGEGEEVPWIGAIPDVDDDSDSSVNMYRKRGWKWTKAGCWRSLQMGLGFGSLLFLTHWLFTSPNCFSRWSGASVTWAWLSISTLALGIIFAAEVTRNHLPKQVQTVGAWLCALAGAVLVLQGVTPAMVGGAMLSFALPSLWVMMPRNIFGVYSGLGLGVAILLYVLLFVWSTALFAFQSMPAAAFLRGTEAYLMGCTVIGIGLGLVGGPDVSPKEMVDFGARTGAWRTGGLTWGSGVPSRQAVGALIGVVGIILAAALLVRIQHATVWRGWNVEGDLRVININVQQGFSRTGKLNFDHLYDMFRREQPHVIMLQETDMMHIVHGNMDLIDYLATWMRMRSLYTPPMRRATWGCAILSVVGFEESDWEVLPSPEGENACFQHAQILFRGKSVHLVNAHFGTLEDEVVVQSQRTHVLITGYLGAKSDQSAESGVPLIFAGDINAAPLSEAYNITVAAGVVDGHGQWQSRDPGAGYIFSSPAARCTSWVEPQYDQQDIADGFPIVATFDLT